MSTALATPQISTDDIVKHIFANADLGKPPQSLCEDTMKLISKDLQALIAVQPEASPTNRQQNSRLIIFTNYDLIRKLLENGAHSSDATESEEGQPTPMVDQLQVVTRRQLEAIAANVRKRHNFYAATDLKDLHHAGTTAADWFDLLHWKIQNEGIFSPVTLSLLADCPAKTLNQDSFSRQLGRFLSQAVEPVVRSNNLAGIKEVLEKIASSQPLSEVAAAYIHESIYQHINNLVVESFKCGEDLELLTVVPTANRLIGLLQKITGNQVFSSHHYSKITNELCRLSNRAVAAYSTSDHTCGLANLNTFAIQAKFANQDTIDKYYSPTAKTTDAKRLLERLHAKDSGGFTRTDQFNMAKFLKGQELEFTAKLDVEHAYQLAYLQAAVEQTSEMELVNALKKIAGKDTAEDERLLGHALAETEIDSPHNDMVKAALNARVKHEAAKLSKVDIPGPSEFKNWLTRTSLLIVDSGLSSGIDMSPLKQLEEALITKVDEQKVY